MTTVYLVGDAAFSDRATAALLASKTKRDVVPVVVDARAAEARDVRRVWRVRFDHQGRIESVNQDSLGRTYYAPVETTIEHYPDTKSAVATVVAETFEEAVALAKDLHAVRTR